MNELKSLELVEQHRIKRLKVWLFIWGALLTILGVLAITHSMAATLISVMFFGIVMTVTGVIIIVEGLTFLWKSGLKLFSSLIIGGLYLLAGLLIIKGPAIISISLTLLLSTFYILLGISRIIYALSSRLPGRGWNLFSGITALLLGGLIMMQWPETGLYIIGLFIGVDLLILGVGYIMTAISMRSILISKT